MLASALLLPGATAHAAAAGAEARQQTQPVYALPGTLRLAINQPYDTELVTPNGDVYAVVGETPAVEQQLETLRDISPSVQVKVWGTLYPDGRMSTTPEIVASSVQSSTPLATATPVVTTPRATVTAPVVNVRTGPGTEYPAIGSLSQGQSCDIIGRNRASTWWLLQCPNDFKGWVAAQLVAVTGSITNVPIMIPPAPPVVTPTPAPPAVCNAWTSSFYSNRDLLGSPSATDCINDINFNWGNSAPYANMPPTNWSARFDRSINFAGGNYQLRIVSDDGARVWIDGELVIDNWREQPATEATATRYLSGVRAIRVEYFQGGGGSSLTFNIVQVDGSSGGGGGGVPTNAWNASYWNNTDLGGGPATTRGEARDRYPLDRDWGNGSPVPGAISNDNWSARWVGSFYFDPGDYIFKVRSDDGVRVYIDGQRVIDGWYDGHKDMQNKFHGIGGGQHEITVEFYERAGVAYNRVQWWRDTNGGSGGGSGGGDGSGPGGGLDE